MTQQDRQIKKVKLFRALKIVFYCLGLPLFVLAVFMSSVKFIGHDPFTGNSDFALQLGFFRDINVLFTSPALYGIWIAFGIWAVITIVHIILSKTVKSRRVRTLAVTALTLVIMLGGMFIMDAVLGAKIEDIAMNAPAGVTVDDYKTQLSYYRTISSYRHSMNKTENLIEQVRLLEKVYNVEMEGVDKTGVAGSIGNKPVTYYNVISDDGVSGVDISFVTDPQTGIAKLNCEASGGNNDIAPGDGKVTKDVEGKQVIKLAPNAKGELVINGTVYSHYFAQARNSVTGGTVYTWYTRDMVSTSWIEGDKNSQITNRGNGIYGAGLYNKNGLLSDGWIFSLENVLEILEDYYEAKEAIDNGKDDYYGADAYKEMVADAAQRRKDYYEGNAPDANGDYCDAWTQALYKQEADIMIGRFSLTRGEVDELIAKVGALLGDNSLFDYLFSGKDDLLGGDENGGLDGIVNGFIPGFLGGSLNALFENLSKGLALSTFGLDANTLNTISDILQLLTGKTYDFVDDLYLVLAYKGKTDNFGVKHDNLYLSMVRGVATWKFADDTTVPVARKDDGKWYYEDGTEFTTTTSSGKTVDKDGKEVKYVVSAGADAEKDIILDIDFDDRILGKEEIVDPDTGEVTIKYAFDFDTLSAFLNTGINNAIDKYVGGLDGGVVGTILGLVKSLNFLKTITYNGEEYTGLVISGIEIPLINNKTNKIDLDINGILTNLVKTLYNYQSAVIKPVWEFYEDPTYIANGWEDEPDFIAQRHYAQYERALYTATVYGKMIGSTLIGDDLGTGAYPASLGLTDLASVQQLKTDLSYQPVYFPLFALRDMLAFFAGLVILFYFVSFIAAQKEEDYATGKLTARTRKEKKQHEAEVIAEFDALDVENATEEDAALATDDLTLVEDDKPVEENIGELTDEELALLAEDEELEDKPKKKRFGKKNKPVEEEDISVADEALLDTENIAEEDKPKKKRFGKKEKPVEENIDDLSLDEDLLASDDLIEEDKPKKKRFGKKEKPVEEGIDDLMLNDEELLASDDLLEEDTPKKKRFGKKEKPVETETENIDDFGFDEDEEAPKKRGLFGKKKKKGEEDPDLPVDGNSDEEVL